MQRTYSYRGFDVTVRIEASPALSLSGGVLVPAAYVAMVSVHNSISHRELVPLHENEDAHTPFSTQSDALMFGFSAGQRMVDAALAT